MPAKKQKVEVEVEVSETPVTEPEEQNQPEEVEEKPVWVTEAEPEVASQTDSPLPHPEPEETSPPASPPPTVNTTTSEIFGPGPVEPPKSNKKVFWLLIILFTLFGAGAGAAGIYLQNRSTTEPVATLPTPSPTATAFPSPTPEVELDRSELVVQVLNGSGVSGAASQAQTYLEELGYTVAAIGNADSSDYEATQISIKEDKEAYTDLLVEDLESEYTLETNIETLDEDSEYDVVIILGAE